MQPKTLVITVRAIVNALLRLRNYDCCNIFKYQQHRQL